MKMSTQQHVWDESYKKRDNFVFYPHEEVIRFAAKNIIKRVGLNEYKHMNEKPEEVKVLDLGCGIGRHVVFFEKMGIDAFGIDLSIEAINIAKEWAKIEKINKFQHKLVQGDVTNLPWNNQTFHYIVSHGVLDSMPFENAKKAMIEAHRVLKMGGLFYMDVISGDDSSHYREYSGEEIVKMEHEKDTVQSYFNYSKIQELVKGTFTIEECKIIRQEDCISSGYHSRYHLTLKKRSN